MPLKSSVLQVVACRRLLQEAVAEHAIGMMMTMNAVFTALIQRTRDANFREGRTGFTMRKNRWRHWYR
ncbi:hypothetical protein KCP69_16340 [Salmonella enterica subsp. enterica]|nr:hypothetical protein KCP69_16340 [Salmonella enterica subsp. enterica]